MRAVTPRAIRLRERMDAAAAAALRDLPEPDLAALRAEIRSMRAMLNVAGGGPGGSTDRVQEELRRFRATGRFADARAARLVCWGIRVGTRAEPPLIEDGGRFAPLIDEVDAMRTDRRPYRRCWRGLLDGYLRYDPDRAEGEGRGNWRLLRDYLNDNLPGLERGGVPPDWLRTVDEHSNILTDDPCGRYGADLLEGSADVVEPLRRELSAGDSTWIGRRLFDAQIDAAVGFNDRRLRSVLPQALVLVAEHKLLGDGGLARLLDRYVASASPDPHADLCQAAVSRWGNPWLEHNESRWTSVRPETRRMVGSWLKLRLIEEFFGLLSEDGINDQRRIAFWKRYVDEIAEMHFALGESAYRDPRSDYRAVRGSMKGLLLRLEGGGARNNAFIMRIGDHVFVEFGEKGNAMYAFRAGDLPFDLSRGWVAGTKAALKHSSRTDRMTHVDGTERWERRFERRIAELSRRRPAAAPIAARAAAPGPSGEDRAPTPAGMAPTLHQFRPAAAAAPAAAAVATSKTAPPPGADPSPPGFWLQPAQSPPRQDGAGQPSALSGASAGPGGLASFLLANRLKSVDMRDKGGSLWVSAPKDAPASAELRRRGFAWSDRRAAWYLKP